MKAGCCHARASSKGHSVSSGGGATDGIALTEPWHHTSLQKTRVFCRADPEPVVSEGRESEKLSLESGYSFPSGKTRV